MTTAGELFESIGDFLKLSALLDLTRPEEHTLLSLDTDNWEAWRNFSVPPNAEAPPLLVRRLNYALPLLRRMAAASNVTVPASCNPSENRI
jgi:hypothetical protein